MGYDGILVDEPRDGIDVAASEVIRWAVKQPDNSTNGPRRKGIERRPTARGECRMDWSPHFEKPPDSRNTGSFVARRI